ncbi:hypothetical protein GCM10028819_43640 [Spirosoma humi]
MLTGCQPAKQSRPTVADKATLPTAVHFNGTSYELLRYGKPYFIKGAGGVSHFEQLKDCGGNSVRIWDDIDAEQILDEAQQLGLTVMFGLWVERQSEGFDYYDRKAIEQQHERIRKTIIKYRNHPALLFWCIGNEVTWGADNINVYDEVNRLAKLVHELDPSHPVSTAIMAPTERAIQLISDRCPDVDILSINNYAMKDEMSTFFGKDGWPKPYIISEYGAQAYWETPVAPWDAPDEPNSQQKAAYVRQYYTKYIGSRPLNCFGGYLFYWGSKVEESHTWFSVFDEDGHETPIVGLMKELWSAQRPANQAPVIQSLRVDKQVISHGSFAPTPNPHQADIQVIDPDGDSLTYYWEIRPRFDPKIFKVATPPSSNMQHLLAGANSSRVLFRLPQKPGAYRLFIHVYDTHKHVATANFSFEVKPTEQIN